MSNELVVIVAGMELQGKALKKSVSKLQTIAKSENKNRWSIAGIYTDIVNGEQWEQDFESQKQFAEAMGISNATVTEMVKAFEYAEENGVDKSLWTIGKVYSLSKVTDKEKFVEFLAGKGLTEIDLTTLTDKCVKNLVVEFLKSGKPAKEETEQEASDEQATEQEAMEDNIIEFTLEGKAYAIPASILAKYEVVTE